MNIAPPVLHGIHRCQTFPLSGVVILLCRRQASTPMHQIRCRKVPYALGTPILALRPFSTKGWLLLAKSLINRRLKPTNPMNCCTSAGVFGVGNLLTASTWLRLVAIPSPEILCPRWASLSL
ncbi:hypothetical protein Pelo_15106 [Pelomyxa schiedti]|nr:hypothetical protein Pelo_15106 [Pelomyxa schiedti]